MGGAASALWGSLYGAPMEVRRRIDGAQGQRFVFSVKSVESRAPNTRKSILARRRLVLLCLSSRGGEMVVQVVPAKPQGGVPVGRAGLWRPFHDSSGQGRFASC